MGEIREYFEKKAPKSVRSAIENAEKGRFLDVNYPYKKRMKRNDYEEEIAALQIELVKFQSWVNRTGKRVVMVFEGRDAAGKGGTIKRFRENLNPRSAHNVALPKPSDVEQGQWYFQRYIRRLPTEGEIVFFDRSWYNRAVVERVFGFSTDAQRELFFHQVPEFEDMLDNDEIHVFKFWLTVGRAEQLSRFLARETDPLKQWKLSPIDLKSLGKWNEYTKAIAEMFERTHNNTNPWIVIRSDDKRRSRIAAIRSVLSQFDYDGRSTIAKTAPDPLICGAPGEIPLGSD
ncbi:MAG: polyphosphate kinase 2 [Paracoccaceae bacterium]|nr:polyphosphate kinase 2 [Paracoccaceae bacterium]